MDGQYESFVMVLGALGQLVVAAMLVERALSFVFEHKWFTLLFVEQVPDPADPTKTITQNKIPGLKGIIALIVSVGISFGYNFDILHVLFATSGTDPIGILITGFVIAGGSAGAITIFQGYLNLSKGSRDAIIDAKKSKAESDKQIAQLAVLEAKAKAERAEAERQEALLRKQIAESQAA